MTLSDRLQEFLEISYPVFIKPDRCTDGTFCYLAEHPDLPGCVAHGATIEQARAALARAREAYISHMLSVGETPPRPADEKNPTQVTWRWPEAEPEAEVRETGKLDRLICRAFGHSAEL